MASNDEEQMFITCEVCDLPFTSTKTLEQHMKGKKHKKQVEEMKDSDTQDYTCDVCEAAFTGIIPYTQHLKSKQHAKVLQRKKAEDDTALLEETGSYSELPDNDASDLKELVKEISPEPYASCSVCEKQFSGPESYSQHVKSKSHAKRKSELQLLKRIKVLLSVCEASDTEETCEDTEKQKGSADVDEQDKLKCKDCNKDFDSAVSFAQHLESKNHSKRVSRNKLLNDLKAIKMLELEDESSSSEDEESSEVLTCEICNMAFSGPESMKAHVESKKHQKALKWMKVLAKKKKSVVHGNTTLENKINAENKTDSQSVEDCSPAQTNREVKNDTETPAIVKENDSPAKFDNHKEAETEV